MQITLAELLLSREAKAERQREMQRENKSPLISFTMNIPGPEKTSKVIERAFDVGVSLILDAISDYDILARYEEREKCGPVSLFSLSADARELKKKLTEIEDTHPLGRLFDMDVIDENGEHLSRENERGCIVCKAPGRVCAAGRLHPVSELVHVTNKIMSDYFLACDSKALAAAAKQSLLSEVYTTPKPGLVDLDNVGSHKDMSISLFERSAEVLTRYFEECVSAGIKSRNNTDIPLFSVLRELGICAEGEMYRATGGKNTHKGVIFSYGVILGAVGRLIGDGGEMPQAEAILDEAQHFSLPYVERDFDNFACSTAGERAYVNEGARGIRGELIDGFPTLLNIALPIFKSSLESGKNKNDAGVITLLHLIANV